MHGLHPDLRAWLRLTLWLAPPRNSLPALCSLQFLIFLLMVLHVTMEITTEKPLKIQNTEKRDALQATEVFYQKLWAEQKVFEENAPTITSIPLHSLAPNELRQKIPKHFGCMAYPYMNGENKFLYKLL